MMVDIRKFLLGLGMAGVVLGYASAWADEVPDPKKMEIIGELKGEWRYKQVEPLNTPHLEFTSGENSIGFEPVPKPDAPPSTSSVADISSRYFDCNVKTIYVWFENKKSFPYQGRCVQESLVYSEDQDIGHELYQTMQNFMPVMISQGNRALLLKPTTVNYDVKRFREMSDPKINPVYFDIFKKDK